MVPSSPGAAAHRAAMRSHAEELLGSLRCPESRLQALRRVKSAIIGNRRVKLGFVQLGAVELISELLRTPGLEGAVLVQAAAAVGSFAAADCDGARAVFAPRTP